MAAASSLYAPIDLTGTPVLITGATAGIGEATAWRFAELGCHLALAARRAEKLKELADKLIEKYPSLPKPATVQLDVGDMAAVKALPGRLAEAGMAEVDILVNNAGLALGITSADENVMEDIQTIVNTNVLGVMGLVSAFGPGMRQRGRGHIVNVSSTAGHEAYQGGSGYCATKFAVNGYTIAARHDLAGTPIRVTAISPGMVETDFSVTRFRGDEARAKKVYEGIVPMVAEDIADQIIYATTRPRHVQIADIISYPTNQGHVRYVIERKGPDMGASL